MCRYYSYTTTSATMSTRLIRLLSVVWLYRLIERFGSYDYYGSSTVSQNSVHNRVVFKFYWTTPLLTREHTQERHCRFFIFVVRRLLAGDLLAPKTRSKFQRICLVVSLVVGSVLCCHQKSYPLGCLRTSLLIIEFIIQNEKPATSNVIARTDNWVNTTIKVSFSIKTN